jgi:hypothetical protein
MKKYLTLAAVLGAIAFLSVSYLAQAESETKAPAAATEAVTTTAPADAATIDLNKISADCKESASAAKADGSKPSEEEVTKAFDACLKQKTGEKVQQEGKEDAAHGSSEE